MSVDDSTYTSTHTYAADLLLGAARRIAADPEVADDVVAEVTRNLDRTGYSLVARVVRESWALVVQDDPFMAAVQARMIIAGAALAVLP